MINCRCRDAEYEHMKSIYKSKGKILWLISEKILQAEGTRRSSHIVEGDLG